jgi:hypothetical protein
LFEVEDKGANDNPSALSIHLFENDISDERATEHREEYSSEGIYSIAVSYHDLHPGNFYLSVKCGSEAVPQFTIIAMLVPAALDQGTTYHGEVCPGEWIYHYYKHENPTQGTNYHVEFQITKSKGDFFYLTRHEQPPIKLIPPYSHMNSSTVDAYAQVCNIEAGKHYIGIRGGHHCAKYDVEITVFDNVAHPNSKCEETKHFIDQSAVGSATQLKLDHFAHAYCDPFSWADFYLEVDSAHAQHNIIFEVEDLAETRNPVSLSVHVFSGHIPVDRQTENRAEASVHSLFTIYKNYLDLTQTKVGRYFVGVKCKAESVRFRIVAVLVVAPLADGHHNKGEVCPGGWIYHHFEFSSNSSAASGTGGHGRALAAEAAGGASSAGDLTFTITKFMGSLYALTMPDNPPVKRVPPYLEMPANQHHANIQLCGVSSGTRYYLGILGADDCSNYDVVATTSAHNASACEPLPFTNQESESAAPLQMGKLDRGHCDAGAWADYYIDVHDDDEANNVLFEVEDMAESNNPNSLELHVFKGEIPESRVSELRSTHSFKQVYSVSMSYHDLTPGRYYLCVRCAVGGAASVRFRVLSLLIHAEVSPGHAQHGEVCPKQWIHHFYNYNSSALAASSQRRLGGGGDLGHGSSASGGGHHVRLKIRKGVGSMYVLPRHGAAPIKLVPPYGYMAASTFEMEVDICDMEEGKQVVVA